MDAYKISIIIIDFLKKDRYVLIPEKNSVICLRLEKELGLVEKGRMVGSLKRANGSGLFRLFYEADASILLVAVFRDKRRRAKEGGEVWPGIFPLCARKTDGELGADTSFMDDIKLHSRILCEHGTSAYATRHYNVWRNCAPRRGRH